MRFVLDGESFELTPDIVRDRLRGHAPESIGEYSVEIDGIHWPVKQVISLATGVSDRQRFQSQASQRWLRNLGFPLSGRDRVPPGAHRAPELPREVFDPDALELLDVVHIALSFTWLRAGAVTLDVAGLPSFPRLPRLPGLYRFDFGLDESGLRTLYIGESVALARRANNYRNARTDRSRQRTSRRIHKEIVSHLEAGGTIEFAIVRAVTLSDGDGLDLRLKSVRRLAENAAVLLAQTYPATRVLNIDAEPGHEAGEQ